MSTGRVKIKSKVVKATLQNQDVLDMFHGVLGTSEGGATLSITYPKYLRIRTHADRFVRTLAALLESSVLERFPAPREHLGAYVAALRAQLAASFDAPDLGAYLRPAAPAPGAPATLEALLGETEDYSKVPPEAAVAFGASFAAAKKCSLVNTIIVACKNLVPHKKSLETPGALKGRFLTKGGGLTFAPLPDLSQVNFKQIYTDGRLGAADREFVLTILHKLYTVGHDTYEAVSSPDVDVNEFVEVIMSSIGEVRKHIPRCDDAFRKIVESVDLLKGNFGGYYKDYVASNNPTIIMENFVLDVSKNTKSSPKVTAQFRHIIAHYRKLASQQASHPKLQSLFQQVDANFQELESQSKKADAEGGSDSDSSDEGEGKGEGEGEGGGGGGGEGEVPPAPGPAAPAPPPAGPAAPAPAAEPNPKPSARAARHRRQKKAAKLRAARVQESAARAQESLADELDRAGPGPSGKDPAPVPASDAAEAPAPAPAPEAPGRPVPVLTAELAPSADGDQESSAESPGPRPAERPLSVASD
jgi:hypothetical protein